MFPVSSVSYWRDGDLAGAYLRPSCSGAGSDGVLLKKRLNVEKKEGLVGAGLGGGLVVLQTSQTSRPVVWGATEPSSRRPHCEHTRHRVW